MKKHNENSISKENSKGGNIMNATLTIQAKDTLKIINQYVSAGEDILLKKCPNLSNREKPNIALEIIAKILIRLCKKQIQFSDLEFEQKGTDINVSTKIRIIIKKNCKPNKTLETPWIFLTITSPKMVEGGKIEYEIKFNPLKSDGKDYEISKEQRKILDEMSNLDTWKKILPKNVDKEETEVTIGEDFINYLSAYKLIDLDKEQARIIVGIYKRVMNQYPLFAKKTIRERITFMKKIYIKCLVETNKDLNFWARITFEELYKENLHKELLIEGTLYELKEEYRTDDYIDGRCANKNMLVKLRYEIKIANTTKISECFLPFHLWNRLTQ